MSIDQQAIAAAYLANTNLKIADLAATHELKPADVAAILRLNGVTIRRGNPNGVSEEGRANRHHEVSDGRQFKRKNVIASHKSLTDGGEVDMIGVDNEGGFAHREQGNRIRLEQEGDHISGSPRVS